MRFYFRYVVLALAVSSSTAMPDLSDQCRIPAVNHGKVGYYSTRILRNNRFRECFYQHPIGDWIPDGDSVILRCEKGYLPAGSTQISKVYRSKEDVVICEDGTWSKRLRCEVEITCGEPPSIEFATVTSLIAEDYPLGAIVAYECQPGYAVEGRSTTSQCVMSDDGSQAIWSKAPMSCIAEASSSSNMKQDACCSTSNYVNTNVFSSDEGEQTFLGTKVKKGESVEIGCKDRNAILVWRNGLRISGPANLTCDTCKTWDEEDIPSCVPLSRGVTSIVLSRNMKLLPGGIVEIRQDENVQIRCSVLNKFSRMHYPEWTSTPPGIFGFSHNAVGSELRTLMLIDDFEAELTGRYECSTTSTRGHQYGPTILNLKIAKMLCPILDEKDDFIISYSNSRKVNSFAFYYCRKRTEEIRGKSFRTCLESGEWSSEEDPSCVASCYTSQLNFPGLVKPKEEFIAHMEDFRITCEEGYEVTGERSEISCEKGEWKIDYNPCIKAHKTDFRITCEEGYQDTGQKNKVSCEMREWKIDYNPCIKTLCYTSQLNFPGLIKPKEEFIDHMEDFRITCEEGYEVTGERSEISCEKGEWKIDYNPCIKEIRCPEIDEKGIFTVRYNNDRKVNSASYYFCREGAQKMTGSNVRTCQENGEWSGVDPVCESGLGCSVESTNSPSTLVIDPKKDFYRLGEFVELSCPAGFDLTTEVKKAMCLGSSGWSDPLPDCKKI